MADFLAYLERMVEDVDIEAGNEQLARLREAAKCLGTIASPDESGAETQRRRFESAVERAIHASMALDALDHIKNRADVLRRRPKAVFDFSRQGLDADRFLDKVEEGARDLPRAVNFSYVAWSERATDGKRIKYIGKAKSEARLNFSTHSRLVASFATATTLSLVFPSTNSERAALDTEAALMHLVFFKEGALPRFNTKLEPLLVEGEEGRRLVRETFGEVARLAKCVLDDV